MRILFLDDDKERHKFVEDFKGPHELVHVVNLNEAADEMTKEHFDLVFLDHDLNDFSGTNGGEITGNVVAAWMVRNLKNRPTVCVHSVNFDGAHNIQATFTDAGWKFPPHVPFGTEVFKRVWRILKVHAA